MLRGRCGSRWTVGGSAFVVSLALTASMGACGGSSSGSAETTTTVVATTVVAAETIAGPATGGALGTVPGGAADADSEFCNRARQLRTGFNPFGDIKIGDTPAEFQQHFESGMEVFAGLNEVRPALLAADMDVVDVAIGVFHTGATRLRWDIASISQDADLAQYMGDGSVKTALDNIHAFLLDVCGVSPTFGTGS